MFQKMPTSNSKTKQGYTKQDSLEALRDMGKGAKDEIKKIGTGMFDQFFGNYDGSDNGNFENPSPWNTESKPSTSHKKQEFKLFNYTEYYETELVKRQIKELTEQIAKEIEMIKKADAALLNEVRDIDKLTLNALPDKPGIYHIRFLEIVLSILKTLRMKIGESRTWLQAMTSKKKKRGSAFASLSKKKGTQFSLSQELTNARSVQ